jgi:hypothetical protein
VTLDPLGAPKGIYLLFSLALTAGTVGCDRIVLEFDSETFPGADGAGGSIVSDPPNPPPADPLSVVGELDLSVRNTGTRRCADGGDAVFYRVTSASEEDLSLETAPSPGCLEPGDEVLLIRLQGDPGDVDDVGKHELLRVRSVSDASVTLIAQPLDVYGTPTEGGWSTDAGTVILQRVPIYSRLSVPEDASLTGGSWAEGGSGVLALRVNGDAIVDGIVSMTGRGFSGGEERPEPLDHGQQGESIGGPGGLSTDPNLGGGGGGLGDQEFGGCVQDGNAGGGGGHVEAGEDAVLNDVCAGEGRGRGGLAYASSGRMYLGSGGGSGGVDNVRVDNPPGAPGGSGGGMIWLLAQSVSGTGRIQSDGEPGRGDPEDVECLAGGSTTRCYDHSGPGGGGAGGAIRVTASHLSGLTFSVAGGSGGNGYDSAGGNGGDGSPGVVWTP